MSQFLILVGIILILTPIPNNAKSDSLAEVAPPEETVKMDLLKLSKQEFLLTCSILAAGIFILVCVFGIIICLMDMHEVKEAKMKTTPPSNLFKMSTLKSSAISITGDQMKTDEGNERYQ